MNYTVQVIEYATSEVVKKIQCDNERMADRVERGLSINLNHDRFFTQVVRAAAALAGDREQS